MVEGLEEIEKAYADVRKAMDLFERAERQFYKNDCLGDNPKYDRAAELKLVELKNKYPLADLYRKADARTQNAIDAGATLEEATKVQWGVTAEWAANH